MSQCPFKQRDRIHYTYEGQKIEGYVHFIPKNGDKEIYVVLTGQNNKPALVRTEQCEKVPEPGDVKRGRGRPRKD